MKVLSVSLLSIILAVLFLISSCSALEIPENYTASISALDFYPTGAKFTFNVEPYDDDGNFRAVIPGAFQAGSIRLLNPENVYGDIYVSEYQRPRWTPSQLEELKAQADEQNNTVNELTARRTALEQTLNLLRDSAPDKSKPEELLTYIRDAQELKLTTETELAQLKITLTQEQEKLRMLNNELSTKRPKGDTSYITVTGKAGGMVMLEAFTNSASWRPRYTMNMATMTGDIEVHMYIKASQRTGLEYNGNMTLHTKAPYESITTPVINPLRVGIKPKEEVVGSLPLASYSRNNSMYKSARARRSAAMDMMMMDDADEAAEEYEAEPEELKAPAVKETLSDRTLDIEGLITGDGTEREFEVIMSDLYLKSQMILMLIPEQRNSAWIIASMDEGNQHLIPGEAELRVDNHSSGKIYLEEFGTGQKTIPFGYAEQITIKKEALVEKKGVSWFSGVFNSGYKLEITNGTKEEQVITVRDRLPIPTDDKIKLDVKRIEPKEKERDKENRLTWEITVPAGGTIPIIVDYTLSYPSGEELQYK